MFRNYTDELLDSYQPDNITRSFPTITNSNKLDPAKGHESYLEHDFSGKHIGYSWNVGDTLNLDFSIEGEITIESDAFVSTASGEIPVNTNVSIAGKKYYNIVDMRSWTSYMFNDKIIWVEDAEFHYPESGDNLTLVKIPASKYLSNKSVEVTLYNFRMEPVHSWNPVVSDSRVVCNITKEISSKLTRGIYYCTLTVSSSRSHVTIFDSSDCIFLVR